MGDLYRNATAPRRVAVLLVVAVITAAVLTSGWWIRRAISTVGLKEKIEAYLSQELNGDVTIETIDGRLWPRVAVTGTGIVVRQRGRSNVPPLLIVKQFHIAGSYRDLMMATPRHVEEVRLQGMLVQIPPDQGDAKDKADDQGASQPRAFEQIIIDRFEAPDTTLKLYSSKPHKPPKEFLIHHLVMESVGSDQTIPYLATLTNPVPKGEIEASGTFGPWNVERPARTPVTGKYVFGNANLDTIDGLAGILSSSGDFNGPINRIEVRGTTETPNFQVDAGGKAVPLSTKFTAVVDGSDGDTYLTHVDGSFLKTNLVASGKVVGIEGADGREVQIDVTIDEGRVEDLLRLAMDSDKPLLVGPAQLRANIVIPPEKGKKVIDKLQLRGEFGLTHAKFTDPAVQQKLVGLSRRGQGKGGDEPVGEVVSDLRGGFAMDRAVVRFTQLSFGVPGALVRLSGTYGLRTTKLDFEGDLRMRATLSQVIGGGIKGFFLKAVDPFFKKGDAGTVLSIKITGTRKEPKFGLNLFKKK